MGKPQLASHLMMKCLIVVVQSPSCSVLQCSAFFMAQLSHPYMTTRKTTALTIRTSAGNVLSLLFNMPARFVIVFLPRNKHLLMLDNFSLRSGPRQRGLFLFQSTQYQRFWLGQSRKDNEIKDIHTGKEVILLANNMILHIENPKKSTKNLLELIKKCCKVAGNKINT